MIFLNNHDIFVHTIIGWLDCGACEKISSVCISTGDGGLGGASCSGGGGRGGASSMKMKKRREILSSQTESVG